MKSKLIEMLRKKISEETSNNSYNHLAPEIDEEIATIIDNIPDKIIAIDSNKLEDLLWEIHASIDVKDVMKKFKQSQILLEKAELGFQLDIIQITALRDLKRELINKRIEIANAKINNSENTIDECHKMIDSLSGDDPDFITNGILIKQLMNDNNFSYENKKDMWMFLLKFNSEIYKKSDLIDEEPEITQISETNLDIESVKSLFSNYGYDFLKFDEQARDLILEFGILKDMSEVFMFLQNNKLLNAKLELSRLVNLLLYSNAEIMEKALINASDNSIDIDDVFKHVSVLVSKKRNGEMVAKRHREHAKKAVSVKYGSRCQGCYENYMRNVKLLKEKGFDLNEISTLYFGLFEAYTPTLEMNLSLFELYKINITPKGDKKSGYTSYASLASVPIFENIDNLIELGYDEILTGIALAPFNSNCEVELRRLKHAKSNGREIFRTYQSNKDRISISREEMHDPNNDDYMRDEEHELIFFDIPDKELMDDIITKNRNTTISNSVYTDKNIKYLESNYKLDDIHYNIDGIVISRLKALRIYQTLLNNKINNDNAFLYAVTYRSLLTKAEYDKLQDCILGMKFERGTR